MLSFVSPALFFVRGWSQWQDPWTLDTLRILGPATIDFGTLNVGQLVVQSDQVRFFGQLFLPPESLSEFCGVICVLT